jgi:hypothetical protein
MDGGRGPYPGPRGRRPLRPPPSSVHGLARIGPKAHRAQRRHRAQAQDLSRCKVNLISLKDGLDLVTPVGRLMANILAGEAAYKRRCAPSASWQASRPPAIAASTGSARGRADGSR